MVTFVCPRCGGTCPPAEPVRGTCGFDLAAFAAAPYEGKLRIALYHPEPETARRAAWLLGVRGRPGAAEALERRYRDSRDPYLQRDSVTALARLGGPAAERVLADASGHPSIIVRAAVGRLGRPAPG